MLLTRDKFREQVLARDQGRCVNCGRPAQDAHHIVERRLWPDGGYYLSNGAGLCGECHWQAETTALSCEELRQAAGILEVVLPPHFDPNHRYDKWGNVVLSSGQRVKGELWGDEGVRQLLAQAGVQWAQHVKYPRTRHLPWSPGVAGDDRVLRDTTHLEGREVVVTVKMDGECTTMYCDHIHARSLDTPFGHPSRTWVKALHSRIAADIPYGWRVCGENVYARHSIHYRNLESYFLVYSVWDNHNRALSWDETVEWAGLLGLTVVPVVWHGIWDDGQVRTFDDLVEQGHRGDPCEGYVVRVTGGFHYVVFWRNCAKFVRQGHVQTEGHWLRGPVVVNGLTLDEAV